MNRIAALILGILLVACQTVDVNSDHLKAAKTHKYGRKVKAQSLKPKPEAHKRIIPLPAAEPVKDPCFGQPDGDYANGPCENEYYSCVASSKIVRNCPGSLVYDEEYKECADKSKSKGCTGRERPAPSEQITIPTQPPFTEFDCSDKPDGLYCNPNNHCDTIYYACSGGKGSKQSCSGSLYFDPELNVCDHYDNIEACSGYKRTSPAPTEIVQQPTEAPVDFDCSQLNDGNYADPKYHCSHIYYSCVGNKARLMECYGDLYYDPDNDLCDVSDHVAACGGYPRTTAAEPETSPLPISVYDCSELEDGYYPHPTEKCSPIYYGCSGGFGRELVCQKGLVFEPETKTCEHRESAYVCTGVPTTAAVAYSEPGWTPGPTFPPVAFNCEGLENGPHANPSEKCSHNFFFCSNGLATAETCAGKLYFDASKGACDNYVNVFDCTGQPAPVTEVPVIPQEPPSADFDCKQLPDGLYPDDKKPCSKKYYVCSYRRSIEKFCPDNLYFDSENSVCNTYEGVFACSGQRPTTYIPLPQEEPSSPKPQVYDCSDKEDGSYPDPNNQCSNTYFVCSHKSSDVLYCAEGTFFDEEKGVCDRYVDVFACSGLRPQTLAPATAAGEPVTFAPVNFDCTDKSDGNYANSGDQCSGVYYSCFGGNAQLLECAASTLNYDPELDLCEVKEKVPVCGGVRPVPEDIPVSQQPIEPPYDCSKSNDGNHPAGDCETFYYSCVGGVAVPIQCPNGLYYDSMNNVCNWKQYLVKCGGKPPIDVVYSKTSSAKSSHAAPQSVPSKNASPEAKATSSSKSASSESEPAMKSKEAVPSKGASPAAKSTFSSKSASSESESAVKSKEASTEKKLQPSYKLTRKRVRRDTYGIHDGAAPEGSAEESASPKSAPVEESPPEASDEESPPAASAEESPPAASDEEASDEESPPTASDEESPPAASDEESPPAASDEETPAVASDEESPAVASDEESPAVASDEEPPPVASNDEESPAEGSDEESAPESSALVEPNSQPLRVDASLSKSASAEQKPKYAKPIPRPYGRLPQNPPVRPSIPKYAVYGRPVTKILPPREPITLPVEPIITLPAELYHVITHRPATKILPQREPIIALPVVRPYHVKTHRPTTKILPQREPIITLPVVRPYHVKTYRPTTKSLPHHEPVITLPVVRPYHVKTHRPTYGRPTVPPTYHPTRPPTTYRPTKPPTTYRPTTKYVVYGKPIHRDSPEKSASVEESEPPTVKPQKHRTSVKLSPKPIRVQASFKRANPARKPLKAKASPRPYGRPPQNPTVRPSTIKRPIYGHPTKVLPPLAPIHAPTVKVYGRPTYHRTRPPTTHRTTRKPIYHRTRPPTTHRTTRKPIYHRTRPPTTYRITKPPTAYRPTTKFAVYGRLTTKYVPREPMLRTTAKLHHRKTHSPTVVRSVYG